MVRDAVVGRAVVGRAVVGRAVVGCAVVESAVVGCDVVVGRVVVGCDVVRCAVVRCAVVGRDAGNLYPNSCFCREKVEIPNLTCRKSLPKTGKTGEMGRETKFRLPGISTQTVVFAGKR